MFRICIAALALATAAGPASAIVTSDTAASHNVEPGAITFGLNLDGVAEIRFSIPDIVPIPLLSGSAALISDRHLISVAHLFDFDFDGTVDQFPPELEVRTTANFLLPDGSFEVPFSLEKVQLGPATSDLAIVELDQPAPATIPRYPLYAQRDEVGQMAVLVGYGFAGHGATGVLEPSLPSKRAGLNRFDALGNEVDFGVFPIPGRPQGEDLLVTDFDSGLAANNTLDAHHDLESDLGFGLDEVQGAPGDSGGPVFIGGAIAGLLSFGFGIAPTDATPLPLDSSWGTLGFNTRVSSFREFINTATNSQAVFVPEPSSLLFAWMAAALVGVVVRRPNPQRNTASAQRDRRNPGRDLRSCNTSFV